MAGTHRAGKLAVLLHADVAGSTSLVHQDEHVAHERIQATFRRFGDTIARYHGRVRELRGDALLAEFERASDAVAAALAFQTDQAQHNTHIEDDIRPVVRIGIAMGEVVLADRTVTGAGVVLAQRMEQLAEPGGICITGAIHESLPQRMPFDQEDLGERNVKGFEEPIRVYAVRLQQGMAPPEPAELPLERRVLMVRWATATAIVLLLCGGGLVAWYQSWMSHGEPASKERPVLPDKPSIAVLPFTNMTSDPQQEYFADGMTDDLITDLSKISGLFVIARNSTFTYKGKDVKIQQVAEDLGVRYVLEGSVQRAGERVRINAQLIDAATGGHLWAERYDGSMSDVFGLQDQVIGKIVTALSVNLTATEAAKREETKNPQAYDAFLQGWVLYRRFSPDDFARAIPHIQDAVRLDPSYGRAYAAVASIYWESWRQGIAWTVKVNPSETKTLSLQTARYKVDKYLKLAMRNPTPLAYRVASATDWNYRKYDEAIAEAERAVSLDPNDPEGHIALAWALIFSGRSHDALPAVERAMRLDPLHPEAYTYVLGTSRLALKHLEEAVTALERTHLQTPDNRAVNIPLAVAYERLGRHQQAQATLKRYTDVYSVWDKNIDGVMSWWPFRREADIRDFGGALVAAGLCCAERLEQYIETLRQGGTLQ